MNFGGFSWLRGIMLWRLEGPTCCPYRNLCSIPGWLLVIWGLSSFSIDFQIPTSHKICSSVIYRCTHVPTSHKARARCCNVSSASYAAPRCTIFRVAAVLHNLSKTARFLSTARLFACQAEEHAKERQMVHEVLWRALCLSTVDAFLGSTHRLQIELFRPYLCLDGKLFIGKVWQKDPQVALSTCHGTVRRVCVLRGTLSMCSPVERYRTEVSIP